MPQKSLDCQAPLDKERIGPSLHERIGDKAWRVERQGVAPLANGRRSYLVALLAFQSEADPGMAWRMHERLRLLELNWVGLGTAR